MCGIAGLWSFGEFQGSSIEAQAEAMASAISRRGPDASGVWCDSQMAWLWLIVA